MDAKKNVEHVLIWIQTSIIGSYFVQRALYGGADGTRLGNRSGFRAPSRTVRMWWPNDPRMRRASGVRQQHLDLVPREGPC